MNRELIEVDIAKEFAAEVLGDPILMMGVSAVLNNAPRFNLVYCWRCKCSDNVEYPKGKVWCNKMCRYMNRDGFCSEGDYDNEAN
mgnify:CR=1 FL=1